MVNPGLLRRTIFLPLNQGPASGPISSLYRSLQLLSDFLVLDSKVWQSSEEAQDDRLVTKSRATGKMPDGTLGLLMGSLFTETHSPGFLLTVLHQVSREAMLL